MAMKDLSTFAQRWVKALESGKYKQTKYSLYGGGERYCCLGVACAIQTTVHKSDWWGMSTLESDAETVQKRLRLTSDCGDFKPGAFKKRPDARRLTDLNDEYGVSFKEIAKFIRSNPPGLFFKK